MDLCRFRGFRLIGVLGLCLLFPALTSAETPQSKAQGQTAQPASQQGKQLQEVIDQCRTAAKVPGVLLSTNQITGDQDYDLTSGVSDIEKMTAIVTNDRFRIGSITKTFVATVILQLVKDGKLALDDKMASKLDAETLKPIAFADQITIRQLLGMTSGIPEYMSDPDFRKEMYAQPKRLWRPEELLKVVDGKSLFEPGAQCPDCTASCPSCCLHGPGSCCQYSSTNYILLGMIIEKVTGNPIERELETRIFKPLKLENTYFPTSPSFLGVHSKGYEDLPNDAPDGDLDDVTTYFNPSALWAAGAIISNLPDLEVWLKVLVDGSLLTPKLQKERMTFSKMDLEGIEMGYGLGIMEMFGNFYGHGGDFPGYGAIMIQSEPCDYQIISMVNVFPEAKGATYGDVAIGAIGILCRPPDKLETGESGQPN